MESRSSGRSSSATTGTRSPRCWQHWRRSTRSTACSSCSSCSSWPRSPLTSPRRSDRWRTASYLNSCWLLLHAACCMLHGARNDHRFIYNYNVMIHCIPLPSCNAITKDALHGSTDGAFLDACPRSYNVTRDCRCQTTNSCCQTTQLGVS